MRMIRRALVGLALPVIATLAVAPKTQASTRWRTYTNERWGYRIDVPRSLVSQPAPENGGGLAFFSTDGKVKLYTYGSFDAEESPSIEEAQRNEEFGWIGSSGRITYRTSGPDWFVSSGISDKDRIFYERYEQRPVDDSTCHVVFTISYPQSLRSTWYSSTERIARSFKVPKGQCLG